MTLRPLAGRLLGEALEWVADPAARRAIVRQAWAQAAGPVVSERAAAEELLEGVLRVRITDPAWRPVLEGLAEELRDRLNGILGRRLVRAIEWL